MFYETSAAPGGQVLGNDTASSDIGVIECYSIKSHDGLHQRESRSRDPPPFYLLQNIDYSKRHRGGLLI